MADASGSEVEQRALVLSIEDHTDIDNLRNQLAATLDASGYDTERATSVLAEMLDASGSVDGEFVIYARSFDIRYWNGDRGRYGYSYAILPKLGVTQFTFQ